MLWRALYRLLESSLLVNLAVVLLAASAVLGKRPHRFLEGKLDGLVRRPRNQRGWYNLHFSRFRWRVRRTAAGARPAPQRPASRGSGPLRVGCFGAFGALLRFTRALFDAFPDNGELHIWDLRYPGAAAASYLADMATGYHEVVARSNPRYGAEMDRIAETVDKAGLDLLVNISYGWEAHDLIDRIDTPCIAHVCTGSDLFHHPKIGFQLYGQPEADYFIDGKHIFSGLTAARFGDGIVYPDLRFHDPRGIDARALPPWREREPLILCHGSLYKTAAPDFTSTLFDLLSEDSELEMVIAGKDDGTSLSRLTTAARARGVAERVHYIGHLKLPDRGASTVEGATDWQRLIGLLGRARLAPDPWPIGGGGARFEAYAAGTPSVHMGVRFDERSWGRRQAALLEVLALLIPEVTVTSRDDYRKLCRRCLYDESFAQRVIELQLQVVASCSDAAAWWRQLANCHQDWLSTRVVDPPRTARAVRETSPR